MFAEPTPEECSNRLQVSASDGYTGYACWYPQMGGHTGKAVAFLDGDCWDVYVWHDGDFPFRDVDHWGERREPRLIHHCNPAQFIAFGTWLEALTPVEAS